MDFVRKHWRVRVERPEGYFSFSCATLVLDALKTGTPVTAQGDYVSRDNIVHVADKV